MNIRHARTLPVLLMLFPALVAAQAGLNGRWEGKTPGGSALVLELNVNESRVTGTLSVDGQKTEVEQGKASQSSLTFTATLDGGTEAFSGELAGDELKIWMDDRGPGSALTLKRAGSARR